MSTKSGEARRIDNINTTAKTINSAVCNRLGKVKVTSMKANSRITLLLAVLLAWSSPVTVLAGGTATVSDLAGQWGGTHRFTGISYEEATRKKVTPGEVKIALHISADGQVTGQLGGAKLSQCVVESNRGWFGRLINIKTDYVIRGRITGAVASGSDGGTNTISAPFNFVDGRINGTVFVTRTFTYPYPFLGLRLSREP